MSALLHQLLPVLRTFSEPTALAHTQLPGVCGSCFNPEGEEKILGISEAPLVQNIPLQEADSSLVSVSKGWEWLRNASE